MYVILTLNHVERSRSKSKFFFIWFDFLFLVKLNGVLKSKIGLLRFL
jgi:hypothetical protein